MDELQRKLAAMANRPLNPLEALQAHMHELESWIALFAQCDNYRLAVKRIKTFECTCGFVYPNGVKIVRCPYH